MKITQANIGKIKTTDILPHHDVVFKSPVCDPTYGLPIGNGSSGSLIWFEEDRLILNLNHTDLTDDTADGDFYYKREDETHTVCRNGGKFSLDFGCPIFGEIYQNDFEARLSLKDATAKISGKTPFSDISAEAFSSESAGVTVLSVQFDTTEEMRLRACLERWGSRTFQYWYIRYAPDASIGISGTDSSVTDSGICVSQQIDKEYFAIAVIPVTSNDFETKRNGKHKSQIEFESTEKVNVDSILP